MPLVTPASLGVGVGSLSGGLAVCWPPSDEPFDGDGWTLRGEPVEVVGPVGPEGNCAIIVTDWQAPIEPAWEGAGRAIEATLPGVGAVLLGPPAIYAGSLSWDSALRPDGAIVDVAGNVTGRDGFPIERRFTSETTTAGFPDLGGYGLWISDRFNPETPLWNFGGDIPAPICPGCQYAGEVIGGGVLQRHATGTTVQAIRPDGVEVLPDAQTSVMPGGLLLPDGRLCGIDPPNRIVCVDEAGAFTQTGPIGDVVNQRGQFWPLSDGSLMVCNGPGLPSLRFDPAAMTVQQLDPRGLRGAITAPDGKVYAVATAGDGTAAVVVVTPDGTTDLVETLPYAGVVPIDAGLLVSEALIDGVSVSWALIPR